VTQSGPFFAESKIMNIKRLLILLAILVVIFVGAVIAVYPNWLWFQNLDFASVFWTMIVGKFGLVAAVWFFMIVMLAVNLYIAQRLNPAGGQRPTAEIGGFPISGATLDNLILAAILIVSFLLPQGLPNNGICFSAFLINNLSVSVTPFLTRTSGGMYSPCLFICLSGSSY